jgi:hypothetical protein
MHMRACHVVHFRQIGVLALDQVGDDVPLLNPEHFSFQYNMTQVDPGEEQRFLRLATILNLYLN